jgi:hypothetical protein
MRDSNRSVLVASATYKHSLEGIYFKQGSEYVVLRSNEIAYCKISDVLLQLICKLRRL